MRIRKACKWYRWLWLSPLLSLPTLLLLLNGDFGYDLVCRGLPGRCDWHAASRIDACIGVLGSALWHLLLLVPTLDREHPFVSWHGRQALLLAAVRTAVPLLLGLLLGENGLLISIPVGLVIWLVGTRWGQRQAARGECSLMRWCGRGDVLNSLRSADREMHVQALQPDALVEIIRQNGDSELRRAAVEQAERLGMVESL